MHVTNYSDIRRDYVSASLKSTDMEIDPVLQLIIWLNEAIERNLDDANSMVLSTVSVANRPSSRIVLLKELNNKGITFFTNYESKKARQIESNPFGSLLFYWSAMNRQVRVEGKIERTSEQESDNYFTSRPENSRIGAWASPQSQVIPNRNYLDSINREYKNFFANKEISRPPNWGGFRLIPDLFEFWQGRPDRLHDRLEYIKSNGGWELRRLAP